MDLVSKDKPQQQARAPRQGEAARAPVQHSGGGASLRGLSFDEQVQMMTPAENAAPVQREEVGAGAANPKLRKGDKGPEVARLQRLLNAAGASPQLTDDGDFGGKTKTAVIAFQGANKDDKGVPLSPDGVVGPATWGALIAKTGGAPTPTPTPSNDTPGGGGGGGAPATPATLSNPMFAGDAKLLEVVQGKRTISSGNGSHIKKVQQALINLGFDMPVYGADGGWGGETVEALGQFQAAHVGARTGVLDKATMAALDQKAVATQVEKTLRYGELFKDGLLDFTVGVGYDEDGYFDSEIDQIRTRMGTQLGLSPGSAGDAKKMYDKAGMPMPSAGGGEYYLKEAALTYNNQPVNVLVRLVTYQDPEAKKAFLEAMQQSDVALYTGHGRYGSGPDFDAKEKGAGNIWINPEQTVKDSGTAGMYHKLEAGGAKKNELQNISFDKKYKVWFFDGCNTNHYMKAIRQNKTIDPTKTDVFVWGQEIGTDTTDVDVLTFVEGLMKQKSAQQIITDLNRANHITDPHKGAHGEGLGDNPNR